VVTLDGLSSRTPADWVAKKTTSRFRVGEFHLPGAGGDSEGAELVIFSFGPGGGGSVDDNVKRWKGMFVPPEGKTIDDVSKREEKKINGVDATVVDISGTYKMKERPFDQTEEPKLKSGYRMVSVVFETKNGPYFIRLVGPATSIEHHRKAFDGWLEGFK
jgi:hypothetical protein